MNSIEWNRVKRIFAVGCSFTSYIWPMWSNIIRQECPQASFYNYGRSGAGNLYMMIKLTEINNKFKLNEDDLLLVMFSSHYREDKWIDGWKTYGNMFNQDFYDKHYMDKYFDQNGLLLQSLASVDAVLNYTENINSQKIMLQMVNLNNDGEPGVHRSYNESFTDKIMNVYKDLDNRLPVSFYDTMFKMTGWPNYNYIQYDGTLRLDGHPTPANSLAYMQSLNINLTEKSINYALESEKKMKPQDNTILTREQIDLCFPEIDEELKTLFIMS